MNRKAFKDKLYDVFYKMTYKYQYEKDLKGYIDKKNQYLKMSDNEFEFNYINTLTKCERAKVMLTLFSITLIISILFDIWNGTFQFLSKVYLSEYMDIISNELRENVIFTVLIFLIIVMLIGVYVIYRFFKNYIEITKERNFMNEIKKLRRLE